MQSASKYAGIEPKIVFKNLFVQTAYNQEHQVEIAKEISDKIETNPDIKLLAIRDLTKFLARDRIRIGTQMMMLIHLRILLEQCIERVLKIKLL